jgi:hypothetical protein
MLRNTLSACLLGCAALASGATLGFVPNTQLVALGSTATVDIRVFGLNPSMAPLATYVLKFSYDPSIVQFEPPVVYNSSQLGDPNAAPPDSLTVTVDAIPGNLGVNQDSFLLTEELESQPRSFTLATIRFLALNTGVSPLVWDASLDQLADGFGDTIPIASSPNGAIVVVIAPEPGTFYLALLAAPAALLRLRRRARDATRNAAHRPASDRVEGSGIGTTPFVTVN